MHKSWMIFTATIIASVVTHATPQAGIFMFSKTVTSTIAPPDSMCGQFGATSMTIALSGDGYDVTPSFQSPDMEAPFIAPSFHCSSQGSQATCSQRTSFSIDLHNDGLDAILTFILGKENQTWISNNVFHDHSNTSIKCEGSDCRSVLGTQGNHACTMNMINEYTLEQLD